MVDVAFTGLLIAATATAAWFAFFGVFRLMKAPDTSKAGGR